MKQSPTVAGYEYETLEPPTLSPDAHEGAANLLRAFGIVLDFHLGKGHRVRIHGVNHQLEAKAENQSQVKVTKSRKDVGS